MRIVHSDGTWLVNRCKFPLADPTQNVLLEPGQATCVHLSAWLEMQVKEGLFERVPSPVEPVAATVSRPTVAASKSAPAKPSNLNNPAPPATP